MAIKKISVSNFKSFEKLDIALSNFNVVIGANASGKSNFVQIFKFLKDIINNGLDNAISMQGIGYLTNIKLGSSEDFSLSIISNDAFGLRLGEKSTIINIFETTYEFALKFNNTGSKFEIVNDQLVFKCNFVNVEKQNKKIVEKDSLGSGKIAISNRNGKVGIDLQSPPTVSIKAEDIFPPFVVDSLSKAPPKTLLMTSPFFFLPPLEMLLRSISIYDFDPRLAKKAVAITGKAELEEDGNNLAIVLKSIVENNDKKRKFSNLIKDLLPFVTGLDIEKFADKSLLFKLREKYFSKEYLPASFVSDGTINLSALLIALHFEKKHLAIIEEPERNIHPYLISKVVEMMKDASKNKQIIITTHNPEVVKHTDIKDLLLVSRDDEGFSTISKPAEKQEIKIFLENQMGLDEIFSQNLLGV
jgi:predicted ATPase